MPRSLKLYQEEFTFYALTRTTRWIFEHFYFLFFLLIKFNFF